MRLTRQPFGDPLLIPLRAGESTVETVSFCQSGWESPPTGNRQRVSSSVAPPHSLRPPVMTLRPTITFAAAAAAAAAASFALSLSACKSEPPSDATVAITHVTLIDGTGAEPRRDQTVLIDGSRIGRIGSSAEIDVPTSARVIDGSGKFLLPGFWDMHVHLHFGTPDVLPVFVANGITGIRELDTPMPQIDSIRARVRSGELLAPRMLAAGKMIEAGEIEPMLTKGPQIIADFAKGDRVYVHSAAEARETVRQLAALKPDLIKHHNALHRDIFFAVMDEAKKAGLRVSGHFPMGEKLTLGEVAQAGQLTIEHLGWPGVAADFKKLAPAGQDSLVRVVKESGMGFVPTLVVGDVSRESAPGADSIRMAQSHQDARARLVTPQLWQAWEGMIESITQHRKSVGLPPDDVDGELAILQRFNKAGIPIMPGTDFTVQFLFPGSSAQEEVAQLVKQVGLTPNEAIQAASRRSAEQLGLGKETGTIETGKSADLFIVDADPLADITNTQRVVGVAREGRFFDRKQLDSLLDVAAGKLQKGSLKRQ